jgi:signal transduction histidine kinase
MALVETLLAAGLDAAAVVLLGWATLAAARSRERPSALPFVGLAGSLTVWAVAQFVSELPVASSETLLSGAADFGAFGAALAAPGALTVYALGYTGRGIGLTRRRIAMLVGITLPVVAGVVAGGIAVETTDPRSIVAPVVLSVFAFEVLYLTTLFLYATYLLVGLARNNSRVSNLQVAMLVCGAGAPYLLGVVAGNSATAADGVTVGLLLSGGLLGGAVWRYPVLTGFPKADYVARSRVFEGLQEAVLVVDWEDNVLDANRTAAGLFDRSPAAMTGEPIQSIVDGLDGTDLSTGATGTVTLGTTEGHRRFQFSVSAVGDAGDGEDDAAVARTVLLRDITDQQTREQRLTVLNRVLRHNVRNELDVVLAHADRIDDEELRAGIRGSATDLVALSRKAREVEEVMTASTGQPEPVDVADVAREVAEEHRTAENASDITVVAPEELVLCSHRAVIEAVLSELLGNALAHADGSSPSVEVQVRSGAEATAELVVADDGPGIPERERHILAEGDETQLQHGQGIGLWFVNWAVTQLGGQVAFDENDPEGSVVTVRLYDGAYSA